jgi:hypothetical protein
MVNNILYISPGDHLDYQDDCLFIGLRERLGNGLVDLNKRNHSYLSYPADDAKLLYGKGISVTRVLEDITIDRSNIIDKIKLKFYDLIVYGSINRCQDYLSLVLEYYPKNRIIFVDGEDLPSYNNFFLGLGCPYFKREMDGPKNGVMPISFAIPTIKFSPQFHKYRDIAICDPRNRETYIYNDEESYYEGYKQSRFAITTRKAGWDCLRHYEIIANGALPLFLDIKSCPNYTLTTFNKELCIKIINDIHKERAEIIYEKYAHQFMEYAESNNTTFALGAYFIETCAASI